MTGNFWLDEIEKDKFLAEYIEDVRREHGDETALRTQAKYDSGEWVALITHHETIVHFGVVSNPVSEAV